VVREREVRERERSERRGLDGRFGSPEPKRVVEGQEPNRSPGRPPLRLVLRPALRPGGASRARGRSMSSRAGGRASAASATFRRLTVLRTFLKDVPSVAIPHRSGAERQSGASAGPPFRASGSTLCAMLGPPFGAMRSPPWRARARVASAACQSGGQGTEPGHARSTQRRQRFGPPVQQPDHRRAG